MAGKVKILVSRCLLGEPVRYDGRAKELRHELLARWRREGRLVAVCPEMLGGLPVPRPAAEIAGGSGSEVLDGMAEVRTQAGGDETRAFVRGAQAALAEAKRQGCRLALLKERSPSCGVREIHDGSFSGQRRAGEGVTAALLRREGIAVFGEGQIEELARALRTLEEA